MEARAYLLDVEGTTTPLRFVHDVLFPYAARKLEDYLERHAHERELRRDLSALRMEYTRDVLAETIDEYWASPTDLPGALRYQRWLMSIDRKSPPLKAIQGRIWEEGYRNGELEGHVFSDVPAALREWHERGKKVAIFSSGSVLAQRLLFRYSTAGDLSPWIDAYFDTGVGSKREPESYRRITEELGMEPREMLFISDVPEELRAAAEAGMQAALAVRPGNPANAEAAFPRLTSFSKLITAAV